MNSFKVKKGKLISIFMASSAVVYATPPIVETHQAFQGFYIGSNLGYGEGGSKNTFFENSTRNVFNINELGVEGVDGGIGAGYTHRNGAWALGVSLDASWSNANGHHVHLDGKETIFASLNDSIQLYARGGYVFFERILPFVGLGWDNSSWRLSGSHTNPQGVTNRDSLQQRQDAFLWKMGVDFLTLPYLSLGFEYTGTLASEKAFLFQNEAFTNLWRPQYNKYAVTVKLFPCAKDSLNPFAQTPSSKGKGTAFEGFYLGGNVGYGNSVGKKIKFVANTLSRESNPNLQGMDGGIGAGYMHRLNNYDFGIAFDANWSDADASRINVPDNKSQTIQLNNSLQLYGRGGYVFNETIMPFIGLGWDNSAWSLALRDKADKNIQKRRQNGLLWKVGLEVIATTHSIVGVEYTGTATNSKKYQYTTPFIDQETGNLTSLANEWQPQYNKIALTVKVIR